MVGGDAALGEQRELRTQRQRGGAGQVERLRLVAQGGAVNAVACGTAQPAEVRIAEFDPEIIGESIADQQLGAGLVGAGGVAVDCQLVLDAADACADVCAGGLRGQREGERGGGQGGL